MRDPDTQERPGREEVAAAVSHPGLAPHAGGHGPEAQQGMPAPGRRRMLIVEDDRITVDMLVDLFTAEGFEVTATESVLGAASLLRQLSPEVIILDLGLPYRSGAAFLTDLKADPRTQHIPVVVLSALPDSLTPERHRLATAVLAKPFNVRTLVNTVRQALVEAPAPPASPLVPPSSPDAAADQPPAPTTRSRSRRSGRSRQ